LIFGGFGGTTEVVPFPLLLLVSALNAYVPISGTGAVFSFGFLASDLQKISMERGEADSSALSRVGIVRMPRPAGSAA
jgi:hypothetical protein